MTADPAQGDASKPRGDHGTEPDADTCAAAIDVLLHGMRNDQQRAHAAGFLLEELERLYGAARIPRPRWIDVLREKSMGGAR